MTGALRTRVDRLNLLLLFGKVCSEALPTYLTCLPLLVASTHGSVNLLKGLSLESLTQLRS